MWKIIKWPLIYFVVQFLLIFILAYYYINGGNNIEGFNSFFSDKQIYIVIILGIIFIPLLISNYRHFKVKGKKINIVSLIFLGIIISLLYNVFAYYLDGLFFKTGLYSSQNNIITTLIATGIIGPIVEELMFRGIIYNELKLKVAPMKAILLTTFFFAIIHLNVLQIIYTFAVGFLFIFFYEKYKDIKAAIIFHMSLNITTTLFLPLLIKNIFILNYIVFLLSLITLFILFKYTKTLKA